MKSNPLSTIKTPQLLELSGIGNPQILTNLGIDTKLNLPGVGEGIIDQYFFGVSFGELSRYQHCLHDNNKICPRAQ